MQQPMVPAAKHMSSGTTNRCVSTAVHGVVKLTRICVDEQADTWNPKQYDATMWIALMKRSGVKYFDFTGPQTAKAVLIPSPPIIPQLTERQ